MTRRLPGFILRALLFLGLCAMPAMAQSTMTITGHVSAASTPVRGARVRIDTLDLGATTDENGRYSFIIPSARVRGQTVPMTVTYPRYKTQTIDVALVGGAVIRDFELTAIAPSTPDAKNPPAAGNNPPPASQPAGPPVVNNAPIAKPADPTPTLPAPATSVAAATIRATVPVQALDSSVFTDIAGSVDIAAALQGRLAGVDVQTTTTVGGTNSILVRGPRSMFGITQPLVVVNGIIIDNSNLTTTSQRSGLGGIDYGTLLSDLNVEDISSLQLLTGPEAALRYGGRGANGVLVVSTRGAKGLNGFEVAASQQISGLSIVRLPALQNAFGQGLGGTFAFFNGKGGGINDATDESWGPALNGTPVLQASFTEAGRADVRPFSPLLNNVTDYFQAAHASTTNLALLGGNEKGYVRGAISNRSITGVVPSASVATRSAMLTGGAQLSPKASVAGDVQYYNTVGSDRPGSGFDESNVVSGFSHMPRQIDLTAYKTALRDASGAQLSWNYAGRNNSWLATNENKNHDDRSRVLVGASGTVALSSWVSASARVGTDHSTDARTFSVATGWMGGYPWYAGRGDFSNGGFENDDISRSNTNADVLFRAAPTSTSGMSFAFSGGAGLRSDDLDLTVRASDKLSDPSSPTPATWRVSSSTNYLFGGVEALMRDVASLTIGARHESASPGGASSTSTLYPAVVATVDLTRLDSAAPRGRLSSFIVHGGWSRSGNDATSAALQRFGLFAATGSFPVANVAAPELTTGWEAGASMAMGNRRLTADVTAYNERSENLVFPSGATFSSNGAMSNKGIEAALTLIPVRTTEGAEWTIGANIAKNSNTVESLGGAVTSIALATPYAGVSVQALVGQPLGAIVGLGYLRDASGALLLKKGLPVADSAAGAKVLAQSAPSWIGGITTAYHGHGIELSVLIDAHHGGKLFSATNRAGNVSGTFIETESRPEAGLLIDGLDATTKAANTTRVSTEAYNHALAPIVERWLYDASFVKLREMRVSYILPLQWVAALRAQTVRASFIARNLVTISNVPNIDPETVLSTSPVRGLEMGQLPATRTVGVQLTLVP